MLQGSSEIQTEVTLKDKKKKNSSFSILFLHQGGMDNPLEMSITMD